MYSAEFFKILLLGNSGVGKSSILQKFFHGLFFLDEKPTVGMDFISKTLYYNEENMDEHLTLQIWDCSGNPNYEAIIEKTLENVDAVIYVYDVANENSFDKLQLWHDHVSKYKNIIASFLIGNKADLKKKNIPLEKIKSFKEKAKIALDFELSSKDNNPKNFDQAFDEIGKQLQRIKLDLISKMEYEKEDYVFIVKNF